MFNKDVALKNNKSVSAGTSISLWDVGYWCRFSTENQFFESVVTCTCCIFGTEHQDFLNAQFTAQYSPQCLHIY